MVLRWEFSPGSTLYLVWQRNLFDQAPVEHRAKPGDLFDTLDGKGEDFVAIKLAYWIPVM